MEAKALREGWRAQTLSALSALEDFLESHAALALTLGVIVYIIRSAVLLQQTPLAWDEYLVWSQAHLPTFAAFWSTVLHAPAVADPPIHPLLMFLALHEPLPLRLAMRLPSFIAYLAFLFSVYFVLRRRAPVSIALIGFLVPMLLPAYDYACTARPYALMLGFGGCAIALWQKAAEQSGRRAAQLILLFLCLSGCLLSHYFGGSVFFPIVAGELWRSWRARRIDWPVWRTLIAAGCVVLVYIPFLQGAYRWKSHAYHGFILHQVLFEGLTATYGGEITPVLMILLLVCILVAFARWSFATGEGRMTGAIFRFRPYEVTAVTVLYCIPVIVFMGAKFSAGAYYPRYSILFVMAVSILFAALVSMAGANLRGFSALVTLFLLLECGRSGRLLLHPSLRVPDEIDSASIKILEQFPGDPLTTPNWNLLARLYVFGPPEVRSRLLLIFTGTDTQLALSRVLGVPLATPEEALQHNREMLLVEDYDIQATLWQDGARVTFAGRALDHDVSLVESGARGTSGRR